MDVMSERAINIAIDGPSAAGKSTIAKRVSHALGYVHLDTGAMYRCIGYKCHQLQVPVDDDEAMKRLLADTVIELRRDGSVWMDGTDVSKEIRKNEVSMMASAVSSKAVVRHDLVARQQQMAKAKGFVMDGRDIGTVVLTDAELKIYQTASVEARAKRRALENQQKGYACDYEQIKREIEQRDYQDMTRKESPLRKADDAIVLDTSDMTIEEAVNAVLQLARQAMKK